MFNLFTALDGVLLEEGYVVFVSGLYIYHFFEEKVSISCKRFQCKKNNVSAPLTQSPAM